MWRLLASAALLLGACASAALPAFSPCPDDACRRRSALRLDALRLRWSPPAPRTLRLSVTIEEGRTGHAFSARGACAVRPPDALRLQLVGPAGALALDLWINGPHARLAVPAVERVEREPEALGPGRPTAFLRWWLLSPLDGEIEEASDGPRWRLRDARGGLISVESEGDVLRLDRRSGGDQETIEARGGPCGEATYRSEAARLWVQVRCEGEGPPPTPRAFLDPDGGG
jgi:hypothetical protein